MILLDSSVLIELFRTKNKENTLFYKLASIENDFAISIITHYEIFSGSNDKQNSFWKEFLDSITILDFDKVKSVLSGNLQDAIERMKLLSNEIKRDFKFLKEN